MTPELEQAIQAEAQLQGYAGENLYALRRGVQLAADEIERLTSANIIAEGLAKQNKEMAENFIALKQERDELRRRVAALEAQAQAVEDSEACAGAALMLVHDRFMRGVLTKEIMIEAVNSVGTRSIARIKAEAVREAKKNIVIAGMHRGNLYDQGFIDAIDAYDEQMGKYANQIEGGA